MERHSRRDALRVAAGAVAAMPLLLQGAEGPKFFTADEFRMVDELAEMIIPTDEHSPGAHEAKVAAYLDGWLAASFDDEPRTQWRGGLARLNAMARDMGGKGFLGLSADQKVDLLTRAAKNEAHPKEPEEMFFLELKHSVARTYYGSKIGIHQETGYLGNTYQQEFAGFDAALVKIEPVK